MKWGLVVLALAALVTASVGLVRLQPASRIHLQSAPLIRAGDAWELQVAIDDGQAGEKVTVTLFNGLRRHDSELLLGTGGVAVLRIPEGVLTQAGESLALLRYGTIEVRQPLRILPSAPQAVDLLTTTNDLTAYGKARAMIIVLPRDGWGNPLTNISTMGSSVQFPQVAPSKQDFDYRAGLGWTWLTSAGGPGRVRIWVEFPEAFASLELTQSPTEPVNIALAVTPDCVINDGRDRLTIIADVTDAHGYPVANGTLTTFRWDDGYGSSQTIDGRATLRIPAPNAVGIYSYHATSAVAHSNSASIRVVEQSCTS